MGIRIRVASKTLHRTLPGTLPGTLPQARYRSRGTERSRGSGHAAHAVTRGQVTGTCWAVRRRVGSTTSMLRTRDLAASDMLSQYGDGNP
eukprot:3192705-Rhodomonas_salina.2